jgi:rubredoxin
MPLSVTLLVIAICAFGILGGYMANFVMRNWDCPRCGVRNLANGNVAQNWNCRACGSPKNDDTPEFTLASLYAERLRLTIRRLWFVRMALEIAAASLLYLFCGSGVYTNFLIWFHTPALAYMAGCLLPVVLMGLLWYVTQGVEKGSMPR